jgi:hypothetical protein
MLTKVIERSVSSGGGQNRLCLEIAQKSLERSVDKSVGVANFLHERLAS